MSGIFITLEGGEGSGKSTQIKRIGSFLQSELPKRELIITREPGGTIEAEKIRDIVLNGQADKFTPQTEALLMVAARAEHVDKVIAPALKKGAIVICDRFSDSSAVYQGLAHGIALADIDQLHRFAIDNLKPQRTYLLDLPARVGLARANKRANEAENRFENKGLDFHNRVRDGFLSLAASEPDRFLVIDATRSETEIFESIKADLERIMAANPQV